MPLLKRQPFEKVKPSSSLGPDDDVFHCEATNEVFTDYEAFFERTILCNSLVWSCSVTGKANLTYEEAVESETKARKRIGNLSKSLKRGLLYCVGKTKRGRIGEVVDDVYDYTKSRYFKGEIVDAVIGNQWCESKIVRVIPPSAEDIAKNDDEITEVEVDGSPKKDQVKNKQTPDHLFKYEVEETEPDDEEMVELHTIEADDIKRDKGVLTRDKLHLYLKNVIELDGAVWKLKSKVIQLYSLNTVQFSDIFAGSEPVFEESQRKVPQLNKNKKGQITLDGWATATGAKKQPAKPAAEPVPVKKKQTPEEIEEEMRKMREAQAKFREDQRIKAEEAKQKRIEDKIKEKERKAEEKKLIKDLMSEWNSRRDDLDCEDLKELPKPTPVRCRIPNQLFGDFLALLEFLHSFSDILEVKDSYPGTGITFEEMEKALTETESPDGALYDIVSFMLVTLFDLQLEEEEEAKADTDKTASDEVDANTLGKDEERADAIKSATEASMSTKKNLGLTLREVHLDQWSITEVLRIHLESSGGYRGRNLQNWRYQYRGGFRLQDDPGFQFCLDEPQILASLNERSLFDLSVSEKMKILTCMMNQMLSFAGVRDEIDTRFDGLFESKAEQKESVIEENKRLREIENEKRKKVQEEKLKEAEEKKKAIEEKLKNAENGVVTEEKKAPLTTRQHEAAIAEKEKEIQEKEREEELNRTEHWENQRRIQEALVDHQNRINVQCLGRDRAFRRYWIFDSVPGVFVEHDDDSIGECRDEPTPCQPDSGPLDEETATKRAKEILMAREQPTVSSPSSDKENDVKINSVIKEEGGKTYSKKPATVLKQKVLSANNGSLSVGTEQTKEEKVDIQTQSVEEKMDTTDIPKELPWGACLASGPDCPVHSAILPRTHWAFFNEVSDIDKLIDGLNTRGIREGELKDRMIEQRERIEKKVKKCPQYLIRDEEENEELESQYIEEVTKRREKVSKYSGIEALPIGTSMTDIIELSLRDQILELEEKIYLGSLGQLKVEDRVAWQNAITTRTYEMGCDELVWGEGDKIDIEGLTSEQTRPGTPDSDSSGGNIVVRQLAAAILQVGQMITDAEKFLKEPLGEDEKEKKKRLKREEDLKKKKDKAAEDEEDDDEEPDEKVLMTAVKRWEKNIMTSTNFGQLFIHLTTLDNSIVWSKSIMNTKCKICRKKTDSEKMLLCDGCDRGYHMYCLKPKLKSIPTGEWFCPECKPKERTRSPKKKVRRVFSSTEEDTEEDVEQQEDDELDDEEVVVPKKKKNSRKRILASEDEEEEVVVKKKSTKAKKTDKAGLANLLGKRRAAGRGEDKRRQEDEDEDDFDEDDDEPKSRRASKKRGKDLEENKENTRNKRRREDDDDGELNSIALDDLLKAMLHHDDGWPFDRPISKQDAPDYHLLVKTPMDLQTIRTRLDSMSHYLSNQAVIDDIKLVFSNCYQYNREEAEEYECALTLEKFFQKELKKAGIVDESESKGRSAKRRK